MKTIRHYFQVLVLLAFVPWAQASTVDLTATEWDFNAGVFDGSINGVTENFEGSKLLFGEQTQNAFGGYDIAGQIQWVANDVTLAYSIFVGQYNDDDATIGLLANTGNAFWTVFQGDVGPNGNFMVGTLNGLFRSDLNGFWYATKGVERSGDLPPVDLPAAGILFISALGIGVLMRTRKHG